MPKLKFKKVDMGDKSEETGESDPKNPLIVRSPEGSSSIFSSVKKSNSNCEINNKISKNDMDGKTSKYFKIGSMAINSEFDDSKDFIPKKITKQSNIPKVKKTSRKKKKNDGQQDIRKITRKQSENLRDFTNDFEKICTTGGIDVDPDQLQMAIALSRSLSEYQSNNSTEDVTQTSSSTSQNDSMREFQSKESNMSKLKTTLEQFGFNVKASSITSRKKNKRKLLKDYRLINRTKDEKDEIVNNKVSQILFEKSNAKPNVERKEEYVIISNELQEIMCKNRCYFTKSFLTYEEMIDEISIYYVHSIVVPSSFKIGSLLKDWSTIPGREKSPERDVVETNFTEHVLFKENLDTLLSGSIKKIKNIIENIPTNNSLSNNHLKIPNTFNINKTVCDDVIVLSCSRSNSPDIFDESNNKSLNFNEITNEIMDISNSSNDSELPDVYLSQSSKEVSDILKSSKLEASSERLYNFSSSKNDVIEIEDENSKSSTEFSNEIKSQINSFTEMNSPKFTSPTKENNIFISSNLDGRRISNSPDFHTYGGINENGIVHFESYDDASFSKSDSELNTSIDKNESVDIENESQKENTFIDLQLKYSLNAIPSNAADDLKTNFNSESQNSIVIDDDDDVKSAEKTSSSNKTSDSNDVFVISDDELDYSMRAPHKLRKTEPSNCMITENNSHLNDSNDLCFGNRHETSHNYECDNDNNVEKSVHSKLYRSSILDTIYSHNSVSVDVSNELIASSISKNEARENVTKTFSQSMTIDHPASNNTTDDLPNVHLDGYKLDKFYNENVNKFVDAFHKENVYGDTPKNEKYIVKTENVSPMLDYKSLGTPDIIKELTKYGLKPLKRKRAVQILEHIYEQTHPIISIRDIENERKKCKIEDVILASEKKLQIENEITKEPYESTFNKAKQGCSSGSNNKILEEKNNFTTDTSLKIDIYQPDSDNYVLKKLDCASNDCIFQTREKSKIQSCRVPLQIVFQNYLSRRTRLIEAILQYEPVDIAIIHKDLVTNGYKFKPKDLMTFLDKKCITIKTASKNSGHRKNRTRKH